MIYPTLLVLGWAAAATAHAGHEQTPISGPHQSLWYKTLPGDGGTQVSAKSIYHHGFSHFPQTGSDKL